MNKADIRNDSISIGFSSNSFLLNLSRYTERSAIDAVLACRMASMISSLFVALRIINRLSHNMRIELNNSDLIYSKMVLLGDPETSNSVVFLSDGVNLKIIFIIITYDNDRSSICCSSVGSCRFKRDKDPCNSSVEGVVYLFHSNHIFS